MITNQTLDAVDIVVRNLIESGRQLEALNGTPIDDLVARSINADVALQYDVSRMVEATSVPLADGGASSHDLFMENAVEQVSRIVVGGHDLARNTIMPLVKSMMDNYSTTLEAIIYDVAIPVTVLPNIYHRIWASPMLRDMVKRYETAPVDIKPFPFSLPEIPLEQIRGILNTGVTQVDELIDAWFNDMPYSIIEDSYKAVFVDRSVAIGRKTNGRHELDGAFGLTRNTTLLAFLIAQGLERNMINGMTQSLEQIRTACNHLLVQSGRALMGEITRREFDKTSRSLVTHVTEKSLGRAGVQKIIHVNNDVYLNFLNEDLGSVESLCGAVHGGRPFSYSSLLENKEANEKLWSRVVSLHNQNLAATKFTFQRQALSAILTRYVNAKQDDELPAAKAYLHELIAKTVNSLEPKDFVDVAICIRNAVCCVLYADSNAQMFFSAMDQAELENPNLNARECALYATIDLLARWLASQIKVVKLQ